MRGPELFAGYADAAQTAAVMTDDGWFRTGDTAAIDGDGWVTITGRLGAVIIRGGENISAAEVEGRSSGTPQSATPSPSGIPTSAWANGSPPSWWPTSAFDLATCQAWFAELGVARFKTPERVVRVDAMPTLRGRQARPRRARRACWPDC